jgi:D-alanyl-D-alanine carboxypeptidase
MTLNEKQFKFTLMIAQLINKAYELGYTLTFGDAYRDPRLHGEMGIKKAYGHPRSCHKLRLAIDLNLFKDGQYMEGTHNHEPLGEYWESIGGTWGGRFNDGNHYSLEHDGAK